MSWCICKIMVSYRMHYIVKQWGYFFYLKREIKGGNLYSNANVTCLKYKCTQFLSVLVDLCVMDIVSLKGALNALNHFYKFFIFTNHEPSACENRYIISSVALKELCQVWLNNVDDVKVLMMSSALGEFFNRKTCITKI